MTRYFSKDKKSYIIFTQFSVCQEYLPHEDYYPMKIAQQKRDEYRLVSFLKSEVRPQLIFFNKALQSRVKDLLAKAIKKILQQKVQTMYTLMHKNFNVDFKMLKLFQCYLFIKMKYNRHDEKPNFHK